MRSYLSPSVVYGFHVCERERAMQVLNQHERHLKASDNAYDWLGHGIYFWESSIKRAEEYAAQRLHPHKFKSPMIVGAVIELGNCLDLLDSDAIQQLAAAHRHLAAAMMVEGRPLPKNAAYKRGLPMQRNLDCAVIETLHSIVSKTPGLKGYDSVRGAFMEGEPAYPGANFRMQDHIQICVRNPEKCIKGYFLPIP